MKSNRGAVVAQAVLLLGLAVQLVGLAWDLEYHRTLVGPDPFWAAPHIVGIVGLLVVVLAALGGSYIHLLPSFRRAAA